MASTNTTSITTTLTFTRLIVLKSQISIALQRTTMLSETTLNSVLKGIENKWIETFKIYALDTNNLCVGELVLKIDWDTYDLELSKGNATVVFSDHIYKDNTILEVGQVVGLFNEFVALKKCTTFFQMNYCNNLDANYINEQLGFSFGSPPQWKKIPEIVQGINIQELPELKLGFRLVE
jgi:hypothetical protein